MTLLEEHDLDIVLFEGCDKRLGIARLWIRFRALGSSTPFFMAEIKSRTKNELGRLKI